MAKCEVAKDGKTFSIVGIEIREPKESAKMFVLASFNENVQVNGKDCRVFGTMGHKK